MWNLLHDIEKSEDLSLSNTSSVGVQGGLGAPVYWRRGASVRQYIGAGGPRSANILAQGGLGAPIGNDDQAQCANKNFFVFGPPLLLAQGESERQ
jgi:hypothetical protein